MTHTTADDEGTAMSDSAMDTTAADRRPREPLMKLADAAGDPRWPWATSAAQLSRLCYEKQLSYRKIGKAYWVSAEDMDACEAAAPVFKANARR
jgi:hypothetical protein